MIKLKNLLKEQSTVNPGQALKQVDSSGKSIKVPPKEIITNSEFRAAMTKLANTWNPIRNQYKDKKVNFFDKSGGLISNFKIENIVVKYYAGKEGLLPYVVLSISDTTNLAMKGIATAYEVDLEINAFEVGKRGLGGSIPPKFQLINKSLAKSILSKWPAIDRIAGELMNIQNKHRVPDADFTAAIDSELGNDDIQSTNIA